MPAVTIDLPPAIQKNLGAGGRDISRRALELLAVDGYRQALLSHREVGQMLGLDYWEAEAFLKSHQVYPNYGVEDFQQDMANLQKLRQKHL